MAKIDHIIFKSNAFSAIFHGKTKHTFADHHGCRLGKWYESGKGKEQFAKLPSYAKVNAPHALVHASVHANLEFIKDGDKVAQNQEQIINNFMQMEEASDALMGHLDDLLSELLASMK
ncbi:MAG: CZB domain-containing protein [Sulfurimonas sp.]